MAPVEFSITTASKASKSKAAKYLIEIDADQFERLAASLGFFNPDFLKSIDRAERDFSAGRYREIQSLADLEKTK